MNKLFVLVSSFLLFGCASMGGENYEDKKEVKVNREKTTPSNKINGKNVMPTLDSAVIRSIKEKHIFDQKTVVSTLNKVFDEDGKVVYKASFMTWSGSKPAISLPAGNYVVLIGCFANGGNVYNYHRIKAHIENEKDYTFFCLQETGNVFLGLKGVVGLYGFYSETSQLEVNQKMYQSKIDSIGKK